MTTIQFGADDFGGIVDLVEEGSDDHWPSFPRLLPVPTRPPVRVAGIDLGTVNYAACLMTCANPFEDICWTPEGFPFPRFSVIYWVLFNLIEGRAQKRYATLPWGNALPLEWRSAAIYDTDVLTTASHAPQISRHLVDELETWKELFWPDLRGYLPTTMTEQQMDFTDKSRGAKPPIFYGLQLGSRLVIDTMDTMRMLSGRYPDGTHRRAILDSASKVGLRHDKVLDYDRRKNMSVANTRLVLTVGGDRKAMGFLEALRADGIKEADVSDAFTMPALRAMQEAVQRALSEAKKRPRGEDEEEENGPKRARTQEHSK
jgi:hypothetical protein